MTFVTTLDLITQGFASGQTVMSLADKLSCSTGCIYKILSGNSDGRNLDIKRLAESKLQRCTKCVRIKTFKEFSSRVGRNSNNLDSYCRDCRNQAQQNYRGSNQEIYRQASLDYHNQTKHTTLTYFVQGLDLVKIGGTNNLPRRLSALQCGSPVLLELLGVTDVPEATLHNQFKNLRHHGEWFNLNNELQQFIETYAKPFALVQ